MLFEITPLLLDKPKQYQSVSGNYTSGNEAVNANAFAAELASASATGTDLPSPETNDSEEITNADLSTSRVDRSAADMSYEDDSLTLADVASILNPLQHIPVIGSLYRSMTGDEIKPAQRIIGDLLYGGLVGSVAMAGVASIASLAFEQQTGKEPTIMVADALFGQDESELQADRMNASAATLGKVATVGSDQDANPAITLAAAAPIKTQPTPAQIQTASATPTASATTVASTTTTAQTTGAGGIGAPAADSQKLAYGGALDPTLTKGGRQLSQSTLALAASKQGFERIGGKIIPKDSLNRAARFASGKTNTPQQTEQDTTTTAATAQANAPFQAALQQASKGASAAQVSAAQNALLAATNGGGMGGTSSSLVSLPNDKQDKDSKKLGDMVQKSVAAKSNGTALPPQLVQDMMLMALDKYKTAGNYAVSEMTVP